MEPTHRETGETLGRKQIIEGLRRGVAKAYAEANARAEEEYQTAIGSAEKGFEEARSVLYPAIGRLREKRVKALSEYNAAMDLISTAENPPALTGFQFCSACGRR